MTYLGFNLACIADGMIPQASYFCLINKLKKTLNGKYAGTKLE